MNWWISYGVPGVAVVASFAAGFRFAGATPRVEVAEESDTRFVTALVHSDWASKVEEVASANPEDLPALWARPKQSPEARRMLVARWLDVDLEGAKAFFTSEESGLYSQFWFEFAHADPEGALELVQVLPEGRRGGAQRTVLKVLASEAPALAAETVRSDSQVNDLLGVIVRNDPSLAAGLLEKFEDNYYGRRILLRTWVEERPDEALRWARELADPGQRQRTLHFAIERLAIADPEAAAVAFSEIAFSDSFPRRQLLEGMVGNIVDAHSPEVAAEWVIAHCPEGSRRDVLHRLISEGQGGLVLLDALPEGEMRDRLGRSAWINWRDPNAAPVLEWADANLEGEQRIEAYANLAWGVSARNFDAAMRLLKDIPEGPERDAFEKQMFVGRADAIGGEHVAAAIDMVRTRFEEDRAGEVIAEMLSQVRAPTRAKLFATLPREFHDAHPSAAMAELWAKEDPGDAMAWAAALPEGEGRERALDGLGDGLEPGEAVAEWFNDLPPSGGRDRLAANLAYDSMGSEPAMAFAWAVSIGDDERRADCLRVVVGRWAKGDTALAEAAIADAGVSLSARERDALLLRVDNARRARR